MADFKPPVDNAVVVALTKLLFPFELRAQRLIVEPSPKLNNTFQKLRDKRTVILANHPDCQDPYAVFALSRMLHENFYYLAARDVFGIESRLHAWYGQNLGCYSIDRSDVDIEATKMTIALLEANKRKLVIFPEGDLTGKDYGVCPFKEGTIHVLLEAQDRVSPSPIFVVPIGLHYDLVDPQLVLAVMQRLERRLLLSSSNLSTNQRLSRLIGRALKRGEAQLQLKNAPHSLSGRALLLASTILRMVANEVEVDYTKLDPLRLLYKLRASHVQDRATGQPDMSRLEKLRRAERLLFLARLVQEKRTDQNLYRKLQCIVPELTGSELPRAWRRVSYSIGAPVNLTVFLARYRKDKNEGIAHARNAITQSLKRAVQSDQSINRVA